jgi:hypothetical protein
MRPSARRQPRPSGTSSQKRSAADQNPGCYSFARYASSTCRPKKSPSTGSSPANLAQATRDHELLAVVDELHRETLTQIKWLKTQVKQSSPQALVVGSSS